MAAIEERWGIRVSQVAVTADGCLVDFRYAVIDPDKALAMLSEPSNLPALMVEDSGAMVTSLATQGQKHNLRPGHTYFLLYRNTGGALRRGGQVTVIFGDLRLTHIAVQ